MLFTGDGELPLPLAGEGWGGGASANMPLEFSPTRRAPDDASHRRSASTSPASGRGKKVPMEAATPRVSGNTRPYFGDAAPLSFSASLMFIL
jgi:hypothetical protein